MPVFVSQHSPSICSKSLLSSLQKGARQLLSHLQMNTRSVSILLTDDAHIRELNSRFRGKDSATNVLSFPLHQEDEPALNEHIAGELGDVVISLESARREAILYNQTLQQRMQWLLVHGLLHLMGYDHEISRDEEQRMFEREKELIQFLTSHRRTHMVKLAINVDHVATIRQARGGAEPDPVTAAAICELAGATGIVVHLREDRRHIQDSDVYLLRKTVKTKLNLEMGANREIIDIALDIVPDMVTLVPEKRQELTTEGGLDVISQKKKLAKVIKRFTKASIPVSVFVDPDPDQIQASSDIGAKFVEIHTGRYCDAATEEMQDLEFSLIADAAESAYNLGLVVNGGHGLNYQNAGRIAGLEAIDELSIGHAVISRALFSGLDQAVRDMLDIVRNGQGQYL